MAVASRSSARATGMPSCTDSTTDRTASARPGKAHTAAAIASGTGCRRTVSSVITPRVPSEPTRRRVRSYPADDFLARPAVRTTSPFASTAVSETTLSRIVPYRTVVVPDAPVAAIPPSVASAPGSTGKKSPVPRSSRSSCCRVTPASTVASRSSARTASTRFMAPRSIEIPPRTACTCPSIEVPAPKGITGVPWRAQARTAKATSSVDSAKITPSGGMAGWWESSLPWCSHTAAAVE